MSEEETLQTVFQFGLVKWVSSWALVDFERVKGKIT
jgi:hypothetical protein